MATVFSASTNCSSVNPTFLQEIKEVSDELIQLLINLRELCSSVQLVREHTAQLVDMLAELRDELALHFALEEAYGYLEEPTVGMPSQEQVADLHTDHRRLYVQASALARDAAQLQFQGDLAAIVLTIPLRFHEFDRRLRDHEQRENELIQNQFDELGVGD